MNIEQTPEQRARVEEFQRKHRIVLLTLLFTDTVDSVRLKEMLGERAAIEVTERHDALLREILARFPEAEEIETAGDSFFMVFSKPSDAVQFALLAQQSLRGLARETGHPGLDRIGIHVGEVFIQERGSERRDLFGIQIDAAARIMAMGKADQILLSRFAFDNARLVLRGFEISGIGELSWFNHGYYELRGIGEPLEICEVGETGLAALTPPADMEKAHRFHAADAEPVLGWRPAADQLVPGTRWKLQRPLGQGGFGEVWLSRHETLKHQRVLKFCFKAERARALKREATLFRILRERFGEHPNIVAIHDVFFDAPPFFLVTDYVDGPPLDRWIGAHASFAAIPLAERLGVVAQIADALQAAHEAGIIHRDVKPSNVLIAEAAGRAPLAKLVDFGIGLVVSDDVFAGVTRLGFTQTMLSAGSGSGTPLYQAPELHAGRPATTRSDIYSLGVLLWQVVVGDFARPLATDWAEQISDSLLADDIRQCVAGDPQKRFAAAADVAMRLRALPDRHRALDEENERRAELKRRAYRRGLLKAGAVGTAITLLVAALAVYAGRVAGIARAEKTRADQQRQRAEAGETEAKAAKQQEEAAKERALAARKAADELIKFMQYDLSNAVASTGSVKTMEGINTRIRKYHEDHPEPGNLDAAREKSVALNQQGDVFRDQGNLPAALKLYRECQEIRERLAEVDPGNANRQKDRWSSCIRVGSVLVEQGDTAGGLEELRRSLKIANVFAASAVSGGDARELIAVSHGKIGDALNKARRTDEALASYTEALAITRSRSAAHPEHGPWQQAFSESEEKVGDVFLAQGRLDEALAAFRDCLAVRKKLSAREPQNALWQSDLCYGFEKVGDVLRAQGHLDDALAAFRSGFEVRASLVAKEPENAGWFRDLATSHEKIGSALFEKGDLDGALQNFRDCIALRAKLAQKDPRNVPRQCALASGHLRAGDVLQKKGDPAGALDDYQHALAIHEKLADAEPLNPIWQLELATSCERVGEAARRRERWADAAVAWRRETDLTRQRATDNTTDSRWAAAFASAAGKTWELLLSAPRDALKLDRDVVLSDLRRAREVLRKIEEKGALPPPLNERLPWIETLVAQAERASGGSSP